MHKKTWENCLKTIKNHISTQAYNTWFKPIRPISLIDNVLTIEVPSYFFYEWLEDNYIEIIQEAVIQEIGKKARLEYSVLEESEEVVIAHPNNSLTVKDKTNKSLQNDSDFIESLDRHCSLIESYQFQNFIEGSCNRLARTAGIEVAKNPGKTAFNPLMVHGGVGLGKTHLIQAIANEIIKKERQNKIVYVASEKFTNLFIDSIKNKKLQDFIDYFRKVDVLIIDDVQFLKGKEKTQEVFFHIFNHLHQLGKQIIMTSDCPTKDLKGFEERLLSRFKWGLTTELLAPDIETRKAILEDKLKSQDKKVPKEVLEYMAYSVDTNIRELEGVVISLVAHSELVGHPIDLELAKKVLKNIVKEIDAEVGIDFIQKTVSEFYNVDLDELKAKTRKKEIVMARQVAMYFSKDCTNLSLKSIGAHFGGRDHSTVIHALQAVNDQLDTNPKFKSRFLHLKNKMGFKKSES